MRGQDAAVDSVTIVIKECITLSTAMRKFSRYSSQTGVAALLGGGSEIFSNNDTLLADNFNNLSSSKQNDPLLSGFIQLRLMLNNLKVLHDVDSLTVLQPFLLVISTGSTSGYITSIALDSVHKLFTYDIINENSKNHVAAVRQTVNSLTHCRFEGSEQTSDDSVLLKVLSLLETIVKSKFGDVLSDSLMMEVIQTVMSLACNRRRSEVLRKAAEISMLSITVKIFDKLKYVEPTNVKKYINDESISTAVLTEDFIGTGDSSLNNRFENELRLGTESADINSDEHSKSENNEPNYGLPTAKDYLGILVSLVIPDSPNKQYSSKVFGLHLLNTAIELAGDRFPEHPRLFSLVSDPIFKSLLYLIQNSDKLSLLQAALQLFTTVTVILGDSLQSQIELTLKSIFDILLEVKTGNDVKPRPSVVKELMIEQISILWTRSPSFFTSIFVTYDCNFHRSDLAVDILKALTRLALPESASTTADSVPPICLEGLISVIDDMHSHLDKDGTFDPNKKTELLLQRDRKAEFIKCVEEFNQKPEKGIPVLIEKGVIKDNSDEEIARFLFQNNGRLNKKTIGEYIATPDNLPLLKSFINLFEFKDLRVDEAIRVLLTKFRLPGESQQIERIVETFSAKYVESQEYDESKAGQDIEGDYTCVQPDADSVFVLSYSIIILNTDLHNPQVKKHMTFDDYTYNLKGCNNEKDFPLWYLEKIFGSIRDKEIVMPEEHHGNERWFDDAWNNLISSTTVLTETEMQRSNVLAELDHDSILMYDKAVFETVGKLIISTLFKIFKVASDDHISTRMLTTVDKCSQIAVFFGFNELYNEILEMVIQLTTLIGEIDDVGNNVEMTDIPVVRILVEDTSEAICVSSIAVRLGHDFKAQLSTFVLSRILQNCSSAVINTGVWDQLTKMLLALFENLLINPDLFPSLQESLGLGPLPKPGAEYDVNKTKYTKGLLYTFASYLKGDEEPTEEEIHYSVKGLECITSSNLASSVFINERNLTSGLLSSLLNSMNKKKTSENARFFEEEILFLMEIGLQIYFRSDCDAEIGKLLMEELTSLFDVNGVSNTYLHRLTVYKLFLLSSVKMTDCLLDLIKDGLLFKNEVYDKNFFNSKIGQTVFQRLLELANDEYYISAVLGLESFWKLLRKYVSYKKLILMIYKFLDEIIRINSNAVTDQNFMWLLGLLDELSSIGAIAGQWEDEYKRLQKSGNKVVKENPHQETVELSLRSIDLTALLVSIKKDLTKNQIFALVQALAHQCLNPCSQLRSHALTCLETTMTEKLVESGNKVEISELLENGLFPLIDNTKTSNSVQLSEMISVLSKVYLFYLKKGETDNVTYLKVQNIFNRYIDNPKIEEKLQELITAKKEIDRELHGSKETTPINGCMKTTTEKPLSNVLTVEDHE
ncbi:HDL131Wp [Eremothecium sinecaudum]|uniref:HDL131Wp n=1 Tax=Eremothecium sinecaudum TaxID=45286 RepID=A0A109UZP1_9SACH|nr:HDL131Wp [Eremothecium sinecaudum]AMD20613.1 HDL131Wp [Eremothecium sinecaudum]